MASAEREDLEMDYKESFHSKKSSNPKQKSQMLGLKIFFILFSVTKTHYLIKLELLIYE